MSRSDKEDSRVSDRPKPLLDIHEVSRWVGLPVATLYQQRHHRVGIGGLALRVGRHLRWRPQDIDQWLEQQAEQARREAVR